MPVGSRMCSGVPSTDDLSISAPTIRSTRKSRNVGGPHLPRRPRCKPKLKGTAKFTRHSSTNPHIPRQVELRRYLMLRFRALALAAAPLALAAFAPAPIAAQANNGLPQVQAHLR